MQVAPRPPSRSAILTAAYRGIHREQPGPLVLDDPLAADLAGDEGVAIVAKMRRRLAPAELEAFVNWVVSRARFSEDFVERDLDAGVSQHVILGAGLDSFAYRRPDLGARLRVFEVDHPASQEWKRRRLEELGVREPSNLVFAPVDFESDSLVEGLRRVGFSWEERATFSWIGVTMYLSLEAIRATLSAIRAGASGSAAVLTYNQPMANVDEFSARVTTVLASAIGEMGERFVTFFTPSQIAAFMNGEGFAVVEDFGASEARARYFGDRSDVVIAGAQRILVARIP